MGLGMKVGMGMGMGMRAWVGMGVGVGSLFSREGLFLDFRGEVILSHS